MHSPESQLGGSARGARGIPHGAHMQRRGDAAGFVTAVGENCHRRGTPLPAGLLAKEALLNYIEKSLVRGTDTFICSFQCPPRSSH